MSRQRGQLSLELILCMLVFIAVVLVLISVQKNTNTQLQLQVRELQDSLQSERAATVCNKMYFGYQKMKFEKKLTGDVEKIRKRCLAPQIRVYATLEITGGRPWF